MAGVSSDTRSVIRSTQRRPKPLCARERSGQPGKQRHIPDWIDRRPDGSEILADLDQKRRHVSEMCALALYERRIKRETKMDRYFCLPYPDDIYNPARA